MDAYCRYENCLQHHISTDIIRDDSGTYVCVRVCVCVCARVCTCSIVWQSLFYAATTEFKGYIAISCTERCTITYHSLCWRKLREENVDLQTSDKVLLQWNMLM